MRCAVLHLYGFFILLQMLHKWGASLEEVDRAGNTPGELFLIAYSDYKQTEYWLNNFHAVIINFASVQRLGAFCLYESLACATLLFFTAR